MGMKAKGFHDDIGDFAEAGMVRAALAQTEIVEAMQEVKRHWKDPVADDTRDKVAEECADTAVRLYDLAFIAGLPLDVVLPCEKPRDLGATERNSLVIRCGKIVSLIDSVFTTFEDCRDFSTDQNKDSRKLFHGDVFGLSHEVANAIVTAVNHLDALCVCVGRDLNAAIDAKMAVNMGRPHKYGTPDASPSIEGRDFVTALRAGGCSFDACDAEGAHDAHDVHDGADADVHAAGGCVDTGRDFERGRVPHGDVRQGERDV